MPQKPFSFGTLFDSAELFDTIKSINKAFDDFSDQKIWNIGKQESPWTQAWKFPFRAIGSLALKIPKYIAMAGLFTVGSVTAGILGGFKDVLVGMSKAVRGERGGLKTAGLGILKVLGGTVVAGGIGLAIASGVGVPVVAAIAPIAIGAGPAIASAGTAIASAISTIPALVATAPLLSSLVIAPVAVGIIMGMRKLLQLGKFISKGNESEKVKTDAPAPTTSSQQIRSQSSQLARLAQEKFPAQQPTSKNPAQYRQTTVGQSTVPKNPHPIKKPTSTLPTKRHGHK